MNFQTEEQDGIHVVTIAGELVGGHTQLVEEVTNLLTAPRARIILDLAGVPFMNSTGLSELVRITAQANIQEARVVLANLSPFVSGVLQTSQLDRFFDISPTVGDAIQKLS